MNADEAEFSNDGKFRNFVNQVERCLKGFEYSSEWADLITNLGKLTKLLQANAKYPVIPRKQIVGKRLSQCLHPALPAGVHLKALECYDVIFKNIGPQRLADDLYIYCSGIFPLLSPSAMHIKNPLLNLFESHFVPLNLAVKPAFVGLLQGLLPGLEEGAEFYERSNNLLEKFCTSVEPIYFYTCLWQVMLQAPSVRIYGTTFLLSHYNRKQSTEDQLYLFGNSINLMLKSLTHILSDQQVLVQRQALDFVLLALNMHRSQLTSSDREELCAACLTVLLRRDMSLNRRFYSWLMGTNIDRNSLIKCTMTGKSSEDAEINSLHENELQLRYFKKYSKNILVSALKTIMDHPVNISGDRLPSIKPFRIIMTIMDRSEIGSDIIEDVLFELIVYMEKEYLTLGKIAANTSKSSLLRSNTLDSTNRESVKNKVNLQEEFLKTANLFFANLDSGFFWNFLNSLFTKVLNFELIPSQISHPDMTIDRICNLVKFLLKYLPIETYSEVHSRHLPTMLSNITNLLVKHITSLAVNNIQLLLQIYRLIFDQITQKTSLAMDMDNSQNHMITQSSKSSISKQASISSQNTMNQHISQVMTKSIFNFREFSRQFSIHKLGYSSDQISECSKSLCLQNSMPFIKLNSKKAPLMHNSINMSIVIDNKVVDVYKEICQLIVEMTSYPLFATANGNDSQCFADEDKQEIKCKSLPEWLVCLIISSCYVDEFPIKGIAMSALLDLIYASRSVYGHKNTSTIANRYASMKKHILSKGRSLSCRQGEDGEPQSTLPDNLNMEGTTQFPVLSIIFPVLSQKIIDTLDNDTRFYTVAGLSLWDFLSIKYTHCHQVSVDLINRLHQSSPSATLIEELILKKLLADNIEECLDSHRRFILLWQLLSKQEMSSNEDDPTTLTTAVRTFDKCMFVLLDGLDPSNDMNKGLDVLRTLCQSWLEQAFQDGHAHKIISPLLLKLLKPDTSRISLQNLVRFSASKMSKPLSINDSDAMCAESVAMSAEEKRIYAISNENGHIKYHLKPKSSDEISLNNGLNNNSHAIGLEHSSDHNDDNESDVDEFGVHNKESESNADFVHDTSTEQNHTTDDFDSKGYRLDAFDNDQTETAEEVTDSMVLEGTPIDENNAAAKLEFQIHPLHSHLLVYCAIYDSSCAHYAFSRLGIILRSLPGVAVPVLGELINGDSYNLKKMNSEAPKSTTCCNRIFEILARHSNSLRGNNFFQNPTSEEISIFRSFNILEIILTISSWFMCSSYQPPESGFKVSVEDILENKKVQLLSSEIINLIVQEMLSILQIGYISHRGDFVTPTKTSNEIKNLFKSTYDRCSIAKCALHCLATFITRPDSTTDFLSDAIIFANECGLDQRVRDTAQVLLLRLVLNVLKLDYGLNPNFVLNNSIRLKDTATVSSKLMGSKQTVTEMKLPLPQVFKSLFAASYLTSIPYIAVSRQSILLTSIASCLGSRKLRHLHSYFYQFIISSLGVWGRSTSAVLVPIVKKICKNIRSAADVYSNDFGNPQEKSNNIVYNAMPIDYSLSSLACLKAVCHFLLLDEALKMYQLQEEKGSSSEQSLFGSLFSRSKDSTSKEDSMSPGTHILEARSNIIRLMPKILDSLLFIWEKTSRTEMNQYDMPPSWTMGKPFDVRQTILSIIKPLLQQHPTTILISLARVWPQIDQFRLVEERFVEPDLIQYICSNETCKTIGNDLKIEHHRIICILEFARGWKSSFNIDKIVTTCREIIRKPFPQNMYSASTSKKVTETDESQTKVNLLEFLQCFLITQPPTRLPTISVQLFFLLREGSLHLSSIGSFILLKILSDFITKVPISEDRKEQRELQELCQKVLENVAIIAGTSLEQPSWFRRVVQVKIGEEVNEPPKFFVPEISADGSTVVISNASNEVSHEMPELHQISQNDSLFPTNISRPNSIADIEFKGSRSSLAVASTPVDQSYKAATINIRCTPSNKTLTIQSLQLLTMHLASILDVIYKSEEKERVQPFLNSVILPNVLPYLRHRSQGNLLNFRVASQLMASLSSYQHTRKSWRKDLFDLLFESYFFNLDVASIQAWKIIIDNLMTQDKSTFKEAFTKLIVNQGGGLNLFTSKEAEYDQTAMCMKKLSFIIYSSECDQHIKSMPDIQERLTDCFRLGLIPQIQTQLFLCFRVILFRMSQQHLTSLWHIFLPALVAVLRSLMDDLKYDPKSGKNSEISRRLPMYLSACKLLDMVLLMKEEQIPQFLYYKWAFVGNLNESTLNHLENGDQKIYQNCLIPTFKPQILAVTDEFVRYFSNMNIPMSDIEVIQENIFSEKLLLDRQRINSLIDLSEFFFTSALRNELNPESAAQNYGLKIVHKTDSGMWLESDQTDRYYNLSEMSETILDNEFVEPINKA